MFKNLTLIRTVESCLSDTSTQKSRQPPYHVSQLQTSFQALNLHCLCVAYVKYVCKALVVRRPIPFHGKLVVCDARTECSAATNGIATLLGVACYSSAPALASFAKTFHIPLVTPAPMPLADYNDKDHRQRHHSQCHHRHHGNYLSRGSVSRTEGFGVYLRPVYHTAILDLFKHYRWTQIHYLYDSDEGKVSTDLY